MGILELQSVTQELDGKRILSDLSLDFWKGHIHAVIGPNGAGKSTLASTIMGLPGYTDHSGDILLDGVSIKAAPVEERARQGITLAWQEPARFEGMSVRAFVAAGARDKRPSQIDRALQELGLEASRYRDRAVDRTLSGGERKRIELASIMVMEPRVVMMDEPDSGIDVQALELIFNALRTLKDMGSTVILITHSLAVLEQADHAFLMCCGKLLDKGSVDKIGAYFRNKCIPCNHINQPQLEEIQL